MYSRPFEPTEPGRYGDIPVQSFEDSFSADAFLKQDAAKKASYDSPIENAAENPSPKTPRGLHTDDLILIGLLILFLSDMPKNGDKLLPILLAVLLLS